MPDPKENANAIPDSVRKQVNEAFMKNLKELEGGEKRVAPSSAKLQMQGLSASDVVTGDNFCKLVPKAITAAEGLITSFGWLIPDKVENILKAFLKTVKEVILPLFCPVPTP